MGAPEAFTATTEVGHFINGQCLAVDGGFDSTGIGLPSLRADRPQA